MKKHFNSFMLPVIAILSMSFQTTATPKATLTTSVIAASNINQGSTYNVVYAVKMKITVEAVTVNKITFNLKGTYDNNDLTNSYIYYNATAPVISGASYLGYTTATFDGPHSYSVNLNKSMAVGDEGYFIIAVSLNNTATDNHTIQINGSTDPVIFGYSVTTTITDNQSNKAGVQTIQSADITLTSSVIDSANLNQGSTYNVVYASKMKVKTEPVIVNNIQFTLKGNHDNSDLTNAYIYYNASAPVISGASYLGYATATYSAPHTYSVNVNKSMAINDEGYFIIAISVSNTATDNHTIVVNGATDPMVFGFTTAPNITDNQANKAKKQTIQAADITLTSNFLAAANLNQGSTYNVVYATKMKVKTEPVIVNNIQFTLKGSHDNSDLTNAYIYYNASAPVLSGASYLGYATATYSAPHTYTVNVNKSMAINDQGYFIIAVSVSNTATDNHTIVVNGATDPMVFGFTTAPNITNDQDDKAKKQTIQAADITLASSVIDSANLNQGSTYNVVYASKMKVKTEPVIVNNIQFTLKGNHDNSDLTNAYIYYNASAPVISGASYLGYATATYSAPHTYSVNVNKSMAINDEGYFIIAISVSNTATDNHTIVVNGATDPMVFGFTTAPNVTDNQSNKAKKQTIQAADITLNTPTLSSGNIVVGSTYNVVYASKMKVKTEPVTVNNIQFTLSGTHDNNDLTNAYLYYNATAPVISGASYLGYATATYSAPHTYSVNVNKGMNVNDEGYFIVAVSVSASASVGKTVKENGATNPMVFGFTTGPNISNNQANNAGVKTISSSFAVNSKNLPAPVSNDYKVSNIFPNPANAFFNITVSGNKNEIIKAQLTGRNGSVLLEKNFNITSQQNRFSINADHIPSGSYFLILVNSKGELINRQQVNIQDK